jgi:uncharacterized membrane protein YsdA (DUF1294 family)
MFTEKAFEKLWRTPEVTCVKNVTITEFGSKIVVFTDHHKIAHHAHKAYIFLFPVRTVTINNC